MGALYGVAAFVPAMIAGDAPGIINTGSKQGVIRPPSNTAQISAKLGEGADRGTSAHLGQGSRRSHDRTPANSLHSHRHDRARTRET